MSFSDFTTAVVKTGLGPILSWWRARQRAIDVQILWPICQSEAKARFPADQALDYAKAAFAYHAYHDRAWQILGEEEIIARIDALEGS